MVSLFRKKSYDDQIIPQRCPNIPLWLHLRFLLFGQLLSNLGIFNMDYPMLLMLLRLVQPAKARFPMT